MRYSPARTGAGRSRRCLRAAGTQWPSVAPTPLAPAFFRAEVARFVTGTGGQRLGRGDERSADRIAHQFDRRLPCLTTLISRPFEDAPHQARERPDDEEDQDRNEDEPDHGYS